jgi:hypothetical protein
MERTLRGFGFGFLFVCVFWGFLGGGRAGAVSGARRAARRKKEAAAGVGAEAGAG